MVRKPMITLTIDEAQDLLEQLCIDTACGEPGQAAPPVWIGQMHQALRSIASREDLQRLRLDGMHEVSQSYLNRRIEQILAEFDQLVADNPHLHDRRGRCASVPPQK